MLTLGPPPLPANRDMTPQPSPNAPRRAMLLTGASRGIGHATVKRFSSAGWRVITCSRHPFPEACPWLAGPEDHLQIDLADASRHGSRDPRGSRAARGRAARRPGQQRRHFPQGSRRLAARLVRDRVRGLEQGVPGQFLRAGPARARPQRRTRARQGRDRQRHLDRGIAGPSLRRRRLRHVEGGAGRA